MIQDCQDPIEISQSVPESQGAEKEKLMTNLYVNEYPHNLPELQKLYS